MYQFTHIQIDALNKKVNINGISKDITLEKIEKFLDIIYLWKNEYIDNSKIDGESFKIEVTDDETTTMFKGKNKFPKNYNAFKNWVGEL